MTDFMDLYGALPVDVTSDESHVLNDQYMREKRSIDTRIQAADDALHPRERQACLLYAQGKNFTQIAEVLDITPITVSRTLKRDRCKFYLALCAQRDLLTSMPERAHRINVLWRIARAHEKEDPRVAITAVKELNTMEHNEKVLEAGLEGSKPINITINQALLPKGALDS